MEPEQKEGDHQYRLALYSLFVSRREESSCLPVCSVATMLCLITNGVTWPWADTSEVVSQNQLFLP